MPTVVITGASGALGRRVVSRLAEHGKWSVIAIDQVPFPPGVAKPRHFTAHRVNLLTAPLDRIFADADALVHLATTGSQGREAIEGDAGLFEAVLAAFDLATARRTAGRADGGPYNGGDPMVITLSSATVYGAWPDNAVPLTESAPLRPNEDFDFAVQKSAIEKIAGAWRSSHPQARLAILRPAVALGHPDARAWLANAVKSNIAERLTLTMPATQFVHIGDLASAIEHVLEERLDGVFNVASQDWLSSDQVKALVGPDIDLTIPEPIAEPLRKLATRFLSKQRPPGAQHYVRIPWVIASDKLIATGWTPRSTSAEAFVAAKAPSRFGSIYARRRQELNLAAFSLLGVSLAGLAGATLRHFVGGRSKVRK